MKLLESKLPFEYITIMIQSEVADRLCATPGDKNCGAITSVLNYYGTPEKLFTVTADNFIPAPKVDSSVVRIRLHKERPYVPNDEVTFFRTIRAAFEQRRKTLPNSLASVFGELTKEELTAIVIDCGFDASIRGEKLGVADFITLSDKLYSAIQEKNSK